jgi:hypothetical protein
MRFALGVVLVAAVLTAGCASIAATSGRVVIQDGNKSTVEVGINARDRVLIEDYYTERKKKIRKGLPPGLAKRDGALPPGLAKRATLPPGLQGDALPAELERQLTSLPANYVRVRINQDIVLLDKRTRAVLDVVYGITD